ncbi:hypothetical protein WME75_31905 [Sorangium sp. So ce1014]|uniref:hypothetical protein n=1 Tax=Sorangium sp. So ce1014 TaxID=3133326 RepID=UPI003F6176B1
MQRTISIHLKDVSQVPAGLRDSPASNTPATAVPVDLGRLYHHYFFDGYGAAPPDPDPTCFEYAQLLSCECPDFRFGTFISDASTTRKHAISTELGQAFCRWILHDHFGMVYFAHMRDVLDKPTHPAFGGMSIRRVVKGDVPDYLCARKVDRPCIAEAKGRFSAISFDSAEFSEWRAQLGRIRVVDQHAGTLRLKTFIAGTRFATVENRASTRSAIYLEDPPTIGERDYEPQRDAGLHRGAIAIHYGRVMSKLDLPLLSAALSHGFVMPDELVFQVVAWECLVPPLDGVRFIGGYMLRAGHRPPKLVKNGWAHDTFELGQGHAPFVGLKLDVAQGLSAAVRGDWPRLNELPVLDFDQSRPSQLTWLADGTVTGPIEFFRPVDLVVL